MLCLVYEFSVKAEMEENFRSGWCALSETLVKTQGSLGARLHRSADNIWISYAQWPDRESWLHGEQAISEFLQSSNWGECLQGEVKLLLQMTATDDLLQPVANCHS